MTTSKTRLIDCDAWMEQSFNDEISSLLAQALKENPHQTPQDALRSVEKLLLNNNPYTPPEGNKCPINNLPDELLTSIFQSGVNLEYKEWPGDEQAGDDYESEWEDVDDDEEDGEESDEEQYDAVTDSTDSEGTAESDDNDDGEIHDFQVLVSHVCRRWRSLTFACPKLWTILSFSKNPKVEKAKGYIIRSQGLPLTIDFDSSFAVGLSQEHHDSLLSLILDLIEPEVSRWRAFTYRLQPNRCLMSRLDQMPAAGLLESFRILNSNGYERQSLLVPSFPTCLPFHGCAPNLKEAVFWGAHIDWGNALPGFLRGLQKLEITSPTVGLQRLQPSYADFVQMIKHSPELHTLSLTCFQLPDSLTSHSHENSGSDLLTIPSLRDLFLETDHPPYAAALVQRLNLPNLHTLGLNLTGGNCSDFIRVLSTPRHGQTQNLLQSISCLLIFGLSCETESIVLFLAQLVALKTLQIGSLNFPVNATIVGKLMPTATGSESSNSSDGVFCPKLEELVVSGWTSEKLRAIINVRRNVGVPLKKIVIRKSALSMQDLKWIRKNVEHLMLH